MADKPAKADNPRVPLILTPAELEELDDWRFKHRHPNRTAALKALMRLGYEATADGADAATATRRSTS